jgi:hypothetical protein
MRVAWKAAPPDRFSAWFRSDIEGSDRWIRSSDAPAEERVAALEQWIQRHPNPVTLGQLSPKRAGKYSPVAEYLRARLQDEAFLRAPFSGVVWLALARSGWLGEWALEKSISVFTRHAEIPHGVLPHVAAAVTLYVPAAREHLCAVLHSRAERAISPEERLAIYGCIHQVMSAP